MQDEELLAAFETCRLPLEDFTHRTHVKVAFLYLRQYPFAQALDKIRAGIQAYGRAMKVPEGPTMGYNETTTHAFVHLVAAIMQAYGKEFPVQDAEHFCETHPHLMHKHALRFFYTPERRMLPQAKNEFVSPDLAPLPRLL